VGRLRRNGGIGPRAGHWVIGPFLSEDKAAALAATGAQVLRATRDDDALDSAAAACGESANWRLKEAN
jgi:hypothetical protein